MRFIRALWIGAFVMGIPVLASAETVVRSADRYPLVSLGLAIFLTGLAFAHSLTSWWELTQFGKVRRYIGTMFAGVGLYLVVFASTEARPSEGTLPWLQDEATALSLATQTKQTVMVDFTAEWCAACHELEGEVFHSPDVRKRLEEEFVLLKIDFDEDTPHNRALVKKFRVSGLPTVGFMRGNGEVVEAARFEGKLGISEFQEKLDLALVGGEAKRGEFESTLEEKGMFAALILVFLAGLASSLTPCVYPLIPITIGVFGARGASSRREGFALSAVYVLGIVLTYSLLGVSAAALGSVFGAAMQSVWVVSSVALLFLALALSSLGLFEIRLPAVLQSRLGQAGGKGYGGAFVMGLVAGVIAAPCVGPIVAGILVWVAQQQDIFLGWLYLSVFALGMGQLFLFLGTFSSMLSKLPRSGPWLETIKIVFAAMFFGLAIYYVRLVFPQLSAQTSELWLLVGI